MTYTEKELKTIRMALDVFDVFVQEEKPKDEKLVEAMEQEHKNIDDLRCKIEMEIKEK